jgi:hypothetical protein
MPNNLVMACSFQKLRIKNILSQGILKNKDRTPKGRDLVVVVGELLLP